MLATSLLLMVGGFALVYAGVKGDPYWSKPWAPFVEWFSQAQPGETTAAEAVPAEPTQTGLGAKAPTLGGLQNLAP